MNKRAICFPWVPACGVSQSFDAGKPCIRDLRAAGPESLACPLGEVEGLSGVARLAFELGQRTNLIGDQERVTGGLRGLNGLTVQERADP
ncbi:hypothetical protein [Kitasatospora sp. NPDC004289]